MTGASVSLCGTEQNCRNVLRRACMMGFRNARSRRRLALDRSVAGRQCFAMRNERATSGYRRKRGDAASTVPPGW